MPSLLRYRGVDQADRTPARTLCHAGYISAELASDAERSAAQELQYCYSDAVRVFHQYLDKAKAA